MLSQTEENYLKVLYKLIVLNGEASVNEISKTLEIKMPTVNSMMKKLAEKNLVIYQSYKPLKLTPEGEKSAALIIRKHRLTEMYLVEKMGFTWDEVHPIAEQIEHLQSEAFFQKMDEILGYPIVDPHGSPIPNPQGVVTKVDYIKLKDCKAGQRVEIKAVKPSSNNLLRFLTSKNIALGTQLTILSTEPYDNSIKVSYQNNKIEVFSNKITSKLYVEII